MVGRPSSLPRETSEKTNKSTSSSTTTSSGGSSVGGNPKYKQSSFNSMSRKHVSMSPAPLVTRSKSMSGLSRLDTNKINGNGEYGRLKREISPLNQIGTAINHSVSNGSTPNLTKSSSRGYGFKSSSRKHTRTLTHMHHFLGIKRPFWFHWRFFMISFFLRFLSFHWFRRSGDSSDMNGTRSTDSAPTTPEDNINVVVRLIYKQRKEISQ